MKENRIIELLETIEHNLEHYKRFSDPKDIRKIKFAMQEFIKLTGELEVDDV